MRVNNSPFMTSLIYTPRETCQVATERFVLATATVEEVGPPHLAWINDPEVRRHLGLSAEHYDLAKVQAFVRGHNTETSFLFWIAPHDDRDHPIGFCQLFLTRIHGLAQTSVCLGDKAWWGKGVIGEARGAVMDFAFRKIGCDKIFGHCQKPNAAALFNYRAEKWEFEAILRRHHKVGDDRVDLIQFAMFRDEWVRRIDAWVAARDAEPPAPGPDPLDAPPVGPPPEAEPETAPDPALDPEPEAVPELEEDDIAARLDAALAGLETRQPDAEPDSR